MKVNRQKEQNNDISDKTEQKIDVERVKLEKERPERPIVTGVLLNLFGWGDFYVLIPH